MALNEYVLDTSVFVNPQARAALGKTPDAAVKSFIKKISKTNYIFYMPPSVFEELKNFVSQKTLDLLEINIKKRSPDKHSISFSAAVFYDFIEDVRLRINKGLRLAEEFAKDNQPDNDEKLRKLREKYKEALRSGIIDSKEDFELVVLAKELNATLVSSDEGMIKFAREIGCAWINADKFYLKLTSK